MNPATHSRISVAKRKGKFEDYYPIHFFMDATKELCSDNRHRILHNLWGIRRVIIPIFGHNINEKIKSNQEDWEVVKKRNSKYKNIEEYKNSKDYLSHYSFQLPMDARFYEYASITNKYLDFLFKEQNYYSPKYNNKFVQFYGVIKALKNVGSEVHVESFFRLNNDPDFSKFKSVFGLGKNLQEAFYNSYEEWMKLYSTQIASLIKEG